MHPASEPTTADLHAIEAEWPIIQAGLEVVDAEIRLAINPKDELARRAHRRAVRRVINARHAVARQAAASAVEANRVA